MSLPYLFIITIETMSGQLPGSRMKSLNKSLSRERRESSVENILFFIVLNLADYCTTACIISQGGTEMMPIAAGFIEWYGLLGLFFHKLVIAAGFGYLCRNQSNAFWNVLNWCLVLIITWNSLQLSFDLISLFRSR
jgi:hypothetical protein